MKFYSLLLIASLSVPVVMAQEHDHGPEDTHGHEDVFDFDGMDVEESEHQHDSLDQGDHKSHRDSLDDGHGHEEHDHEEEKHDDHSDHASHRDSLDDSHGHDEHDHEEAKHGDHDGHAHEEDSHDDHSEDDHGHGHGHGEEASHAELNTAQLATANIETLVVSKQRLPELISAPGEVIVNAYRTTAVTPRIGAQVMKRHVRLGDHVKKGQALVTLTSVEMASAQGELLEAEAELRRVKELGRKVVSEKRFIAAQISYQQADSQASAYGMSNRQIDALIKQNDATKANGQFQLLSFQDGTVISDDFVVGQIVEPGHTLMQVTDESRLWIEARLPVGSADGINKEAQATVVLGNANVSGKVAQIHHLLDEITRTQAVYIEVPNENHQLHPGQFVTVNIDSQHVSEGIAVPMEAVLRNNKGEWRVFVETSAGRFEPQVVNLVANRGDQVVIEGIEEGTRIAGRGAFFVQSEMAKSAFDTHNH